MLRITAVRRHGLLEKAEYENHVLHLDFPTTNEYHDLLRCIMVLSKLTGRCKVVVQSNNTCSP